MPKEQAKNRFEHLGNGETIIYFDNAPGKYTIIDTEDFDNVRWIKWWLDNHGYVQGWLYGRTVAMHRVILGVGSDVIVDHINRNKLDNRKVNLRIADYSINRINSRMNRRNTSGFRGVCWVKRDQKFRATATVNGVDVNLGNYDTAEEAYIAYLSFMVANRGFNVLPDYLQRDAIRFGVVKNM